MNKSLKQFPLILLLLLLLPVGVLGQQPSRGERKYVHGSASTNATATAQGANTDASRWGAVIFDVELVSGSGTITFRHYPDGTTVRDIAAVKMDTGVEATTATGDGAFVVRTFSSKVYAEITACSSCAFKVYSIQSFGVMSKAGGASLSGASDGQVLIRASGAIAGDSDLTFATDTLTATKVIASTNITIGAGAALTSSGAGGALGTAAFKATGTSGNTIPLLDGLNVFSRLFTVTQGTANEGILASTGFSLTGSDATSMVNLIGTLNTSGAPDLIKADITNTASSGSTTFINFLVSGASRFKVSLGGAITASGSLTVADALFNSAGYLQFGSRSYIESPVNNAFNINNNAGTVGARLQVGAPAIASGFGTDPALTTGATDSFGQIDIGTGGIASSGTINFSTTWATAPFCLAQNNTTGALMRASASTTVLTLTATAPWGASDKVSWVCAGSR